MSRKFRVAALASFIRIVAPYPLPQAGLEAQLSAGSEAVPTSIHILSVLEVNPLLPSSLLFPVQFPPVLSVEFPSASCLFGCTASSTPAVITPSLSSFATPSPCTSIRESPTATITGTISPSPSPTMWTAPIAMEDLSSFNITKFADGQSNVDIVAAVPAWASIQHASVTSSPTPATTRVEVSTTTISSYSESRSTPPVSQNSTHHVIQVFFPLNSSNPGTPGPSNPVGGADFYASPITLQRATNVTLEYSVFFPVDFDFVKGGKLPGLYGGHDGCSGGAEAEECFSTRLMWRKSGMGELYLYAPRAMQSASLCSTPPLSICNSTDGMSIGRGSFNFTRGEWTTLRQTVTLNTPGVADGSFVLEVNGDIVLNSNAVYYRNAPDTTSPTAGDNAQTAAGDGNGLVGALPGGLLDNLTASILLELEPREFVGHHAGQPETLPHGSVTSVKQLRRSPAKFTQFGRRSDTISVVSFLGLFFSTFFGGNGSGWAATADTYTWFKDFTITMNR